MCMYICMYTCTHWFIDVYKDVDYPTQGCTANCQTKNLEFWNLSQTNS